MMWHYLLLTSQTLFPKRRANAAGVLLLGSATAAPVVILEPCLFESISVSTGGTSEASRTMT